MPSQDKNPLQSFFSVGKCSLKQYALEREGRFSVDCESFRNSRGEKMFKLFLHGFPSSPFYLTSEHIESYQATAIPTSNFPLDINAQDPFCVLESHLLTILRGNGYGSISLRFEKCKKKKAAFICSVTFSYRHTAVS